MTCNTFCPTIRRASRRAVAERVALPARTQTRPALRQVDKPKVTLYSLTLAITVVRATKTAPTSNPSEIAQQIRQRFEAMSKPRTIAEVKNDIRDRVGRRAPFLHADKNEAEEALAKMADFEGESWAGAWNELGARWEEKAVAAEKSHNASQAKEAFLKSYGYYGIARHPFPSTPGKHHGYAKTRDMFLAASKYFEVPVERVSIPFQGKAIVGHLRLPKNLPAPMIMHWGGIDNWKEERHSFGEAFRQGRLGLFYHRQPRHRRMPAARRTRCAPSPHRRARLSSSKA